MNLIDTSEEAPRERPSEPTERKKIGVVFSGGGSRCAYQIGALLALRDFVAQRQIAVVAGSSMGALNAIVLSTCLRHGIDSAIEQTQQLWQQSTFSNTFSGSLPTSFIRSLLVAYRHYRTPGPWPSDLYLYKPTPMGERIDSILKDAGGLNRSMEETDLEAVAITATIEGDIRKPLVMACLEKPITNGMMKGACFDLTEVETLTSIHGLCSAALPSVFPAVTIELQGKPVKLVDGGIADNTPIDSALRLGAEDLLYIDATGRQWWLDHFGKSSDSRADWEIPAKEATYSMLPSGQMVSCFSRPGLGKVLLDTVGSSRKEFIASVGPIWPLFRLMFNKMGSEIAYEVMSYISVHPLYLTDLIRCGYEDGKKIAEKLSAEESARPQLGE